jgi:transcriptional regulator with XRE-family HTH domain
MWSGEIGITPCFMLKILAYLLNLYEQYVKLFCKAKNKCYTLAMKGGSMDQFPLGRRLRRVRRVRDLTQQELGRLSGVNPITISRLEKGDARHAQAQTVRDLAKALRVSADYLLGLSNDTNALLHEAGEEEPDEDAPVAREELTHV